eukprot:gene38457-50495_t
MPAVVISTNSALLRIASMLAQLQDRGEAIINQVEEVTKRANQLLSDPNQKRAADALENIAA